MRVLTAIVGIILITSPSARADDRPNRFGIVAQTNANNVWEVDTATGDIRLCMPPTGHSAAPECSPPAPWSALGHPVGAAYS
jgi:hypothetical protein